MPQVPKGGSGGWSEIKKENERFTRYYTGQLGDASLVESVLEAMGGDLPTTFRVALADDEAHCEEVVRQMEAALSEARADVTIPKEKQVTRLDWCKMGFQVKMTKKEMSKGYPTMRKFYDFLVRNSESGVLVRQEAVSMIPTMFLQAKADDVVLDLCAAPGSKTSQIMENVSRGDGIAIANDLDKKRCGVMTARLGRMDPKAALGLVCTNENAAKTRFTTRPDKILADVVCSGDGTMRKNPVLWRRWRSSLGGSTHPVQIAILKKGLDLLPVGGRLVYSTCSLNPIENEAVVSHCLAAYPGVTIADVSSAHPGLKRDEGLATWKVMSHKTNEFYEKIEDVPDVARPTVAKSMFPTGNLEMKKCMRFYPHTMDTGGFFVAVLEKKADGQVGEAVGGEVQKLFAEVDDEVVQRLEKVMSCKLPPTIKLTRRVTPQGFSRKIYSGKPQSLRFLEDNPSVTVLSWGVKFAELLGADMTPLPSQAAGSLLHPAIPHTTVTLKTLRSILATRDVPSTVYDGEAVHCLVLEGSETRPLTVLIQGKKVLGDSVEIAGIRDRLPEDNTVNDDEMPAKRAKV